MKWGISAYAGLGMPDIQKYIRKAKGLGATKLFSSLHIPEVNKELMKEFQLIICTAMEEGLSLYIDTSSQYYHLLPFEEYPDLSIRLDFGFDDDEILSLSQKHTLVLNASTLTLSQLQTLESQGISFQNIIACHNYYPRPETGLSITFYQDKNILCQQFGLSIDTFISGNRWHRPPIGEGLVTIENHRNVSSLIAAQECRILGSNTVLFGDMATDQELTMLSSLQDGIWLLPVQWDTDLFTIYRNNIHTNRVDPGDGLLRSEHSKSLCTETIKEYNCIERKKGAITIDNQLYQRYQGELQITTKSFQSDPRVNVIGKVLDEGILLDYIKAQDKWQFYPIN